MEIINQVTIVLVHRQRHDYLAYVEEIPQLTASGQTMAEAKDNLISELERYEEETYSAYSIAEYKYEVASYL